MRAYECLLTAEGKAALLEYLRAADPSVRIRRVQSQEEWRIGARTRYEWCKFFKEESTGLWSVTFGGNFKLPDILEPMFTKVVATHHGCSWAWPVRTSAAG
jgi:hypothetical protein